MGQCRTCGRNTKYPHNNGWCPICFYLNYKDPRMYISICLTFIILQLPLINENGLRVWLMNTLFQITGWQPFLIAGIIINILIIVSTYIGISYFLYGLFKKIS